MTYTACGDPPLHPDFVTITFGTTGIGDAWNTPIFYAPVQTTFTLPDTNGIQNGLLGGYIVDPPLYEPSPTKSLLNTVLDQQKIQELMQLLQSQHQKTAFSLLMPNSEPPVQELAPAPKEEPEPAQDLTRPFQRKLDLD